MSAPPRKRRRSSVTLAPRISTADQALALARKALSQNPVKELKFIDTSVSDGNLFDGAGNEVITFLTPIAVGDSKSSRDGDKVMLKSISSRWSIKSVKACLCRCMIVYLAHPFIDSGNYAAGNFLESVAVESHSEMDRTKQFVVLMDRTYKLDPAFSAEQTFVYDKMFRKLNHPQSYTVGADGTDESLLTQGGLFMIWVSDGAATTNVDLNISTRVRFVDV